MEDLTQERLPRKSAQGASDAKDAKPGEARPQAMPRSRTVTLKTPGGKRLEIRRVRLKSGGRPRGGSPEVESRTSFRALKGELPRHKDEPKKAYRQRLADAMAARVR